MKPPPDRKVAPSLQWMPASLEFCLVMLAAFGTSIYGSLYAVFHVLPRAPISNGQLQSLLIFEPVVLLVLGLFLKRRGWTREELGLTASTRDVPQGLLLAVIAYACYVALWMLIATFSASVRQAAEETVLANSPLDLTTVLVVSLVNPIFEEVFVCGYVICFMKERFGLTAAINASILIRLSYHLYQGSVGIIGIIPDGIVFAYAFARTGRLWPIIVAHALFDFVGLMFYQH